MSHWKPLTVENLIRAQCIFVSKGYDYDDIKNPRYLEKKHGEHWLKTYAEEAVRGIKAGESEYEFIFNVLGSYRCRMYVYSSFMNQDSFPGAEYSLLVTHMNHILGLRDEVEARFSRIERALLDESFPARKL